MTNLNKTNHRHSEFISESNRHCEQSEAISSRLPRATALAMTEQTGRSMVEMLGVLAVIGVLSITGISGYTTAMNKHRANEILDAASKRAVVVSTQLQSGRTNPTLAEFGEDATVQGVSFSLKATNGNDWATGQDRFAIQTSAIDEDICREIYNITGTSGTVREMYSDSNALSSSSGCSETPSAMRFVYNNDLTNTAVAGDYKDSTSCGTYATTGRTWCASVSKCVEGSDCCSVLTYDSQCQTCENGTIGNKENTEPCNYNGGSNNGKCNGSGACVAASACGTGEKKVTYDSTTHCVKIVSGSYTHPQAYNACPNDMSLMTKDQLLAIMDDDCSDEGSNYECDTSQLSSKLGWNSQWLWLADCYVGCPSDLGNENDTSGLAWSVTDVGDVYFINRRGSGDALCVR